MISPKKGATISSRRRLQRPLDPYHLTTKEFADLLRVCSADGILVANIIDHFETGIFLPSYIRTLAESFGKDRVALVADAEFERLGINTNIVAASPASHPWKDIEKTSEGRCFVRTRLA